LSTWTAKLAIVPPVQRVEHLGGVEKVERLHGA
jgi:hypothetical protein